MRTRIATAAALVIVVTWSAFAHGQDTNRNQANPNISKEQRITRWLASQDGDKDGKIAFDESSGLMKTHFKRNDANNDGFLDKDELGDLADRLSGGAARSRNGRPGANRARQQRPVPTSEQVLQRVPDGVTVELDIPYREGNEAWKVDLAMPTEASDAPRPAIVFVHGGGWVSGDKRAGPFLNQALDYAANGYVCISVNYRLDPTKLPCVQDVKCAVRWFRAHAEKYNFDPDRVGAYGNSAGAGHLVTMLGVSDTEKALEGDGPWQEYSSVVQAVAASATPTVPSIRGGSEEDIRLIQPMSYVRADVPPFLLFHEESDRTVNVSNSDDFVKALKEAGAKDVTYQRYTDGSGHGVFGKNLEETGAAMAAFFARTIGE